MRCPPAQDHPGAGRTLLVHDDHQLVLDQPCGAITDAQVAMQFKRRHPRLGLCQQVHAEKPNRQRQLAGVENAARYEADLSAAGAALPVRTAAARKAAVFGTTGGWATEAVRPLRLQQGLAALLLGTKPRLKLAQRHPGWNWTRFICIDTSVSYAVILRPDRLTA